MLSGTLTLDSSGPRPVTRVARRARTVLGDPVQVVRIAALLVCLGALARTSADPDLWGHVRFGGDIVASRQLPASDPYSFTADRLWVNHEWLAEVLMFGAWRALGSTGLVALKLILVAGVLLLAVRHLRPLTDVMTRDRFTALLVIATMPRVFTLRPQVFSLVMFAALLSLLSAVDRGRRRHLALIPLVMAAWVNLHGGWLVGLGVLAVWLAFRVLDRRATWRTRGTLVATGAAAGGATLLNPYGVRMWSFLWRTVGLARPDIADWQPVYTLPLPLVALWTLVFASGLYIVARAGRRTNWTYAAIVGLLALMSFRVSRLDAFVAIAVVMLLAPQLPLRPAAKGSSSRRGRLASMPMALGALALAVVPGVLLLVRAARRIDIGEGFPEPLAVSVMHANHVRGRMIVWFGWGEYAIWHLAPAVKVSIDGRRETIYSEATIAANWRFAMNAGRGALGYADRVGADYVWMPNDAPATRALQAAGWHRVFAGPVSSVLARRAGDMPARSGPVAGSRGFPGP